MMERYFNPILSNLYNYLAPKGDGNIKAANSDFIRKLLYNYLAPKGDENFK